MRIYRGGRKTPIPHRDFWIYRSFWCNGVGARVDICPVKGKVSMEISPMASLRAIRVSFATLHTSLIVLSSIGDWGPYLPDEEAGARSGNCAFFSTQCRMRRVLNTFSSYLILIMF